LEEKEPVNKVDPTGESRRPQGALLVDGEGGILSALGGLSGQCLMYRNGYWTYEVCSKSHIRQYRHRGESSAPKPDGKLSFSLGNFDKGVARPEQGAYEEYFEGGSECGTSKQLRSATLRWQCGTPPDRGAAGTTVSGAGPRGHLVTASISDVSEPTPCHYLVDIYTQALCGI